MFSSFKPGLLSAIFTLSSSAVPKPLLREVNRPVIILFDFRLVRN